MMGVSVRLCTLDSSHQTGTFHSITPLGKSCRQCVYVAAMNCSFLQFYRFPELCTFPCVLYRKEIRWPTLTILEIMKWTLNWTLVLRLSGKDQRFSINWRQKALGYKQQKMFDPLIKMTTLLFFFFFPCCLLDLW